jgi:hypothetical protein
LPSPLYPSSSSSQYMGSVIVNNSMRTLQFNTRTQVTK